MKVAKMVELMAAGKVVMTAKLLAELLAAQKVDSSVDQ
jgi:hypothetical protein